MRERPVRLWVLLVGIFTSTLCIVLTLFYVLMMMEQKEQMHRDEETLLLSIGRQLASEAEVKQALRDEKASPQLQSYTNELAKNYGLDFIVLMNQDAIRITHPDPEKIGQPFTGGDETPAIEGKESLSIGNGTLGQSFRGFVPVKEDGEQLGVVALGIKMTSLQSLILLSQKGYRKALFISLLLGGGIALFVAFYLKRQLHNLEPQEISRLLEERNSMLEETKDVVFVLDLAKNILLANRAATALPLATASEDGLVGQSLLTILPALQHVDFDKKQERLVQQEGQDYVFSSAPIIVRNQQIGYIIFLRNATESLFIADQLANTTAYATALQSQAHEFMNKLHVIYGLVDLEAYEELTIYLDDILKPEKEFAHRLAILIKNPLLAGFLIGERQKFLEKKCQLLVEIFPEIPQGAVAHETKVLLNLYQYMHHLLLQKHLTQEVFMKIEYQENQLQTSWQLAEEMLTPTEQVTLQQVGYFQQLLHEVNGKITFQQAQGVLEVTITNDYRKEQL